MLLLAPLPPTAWPALAASPRARGSAPIPGRRRYRIPVAAPPSPRHPLTRPRALTPDASPTWTLDQIAGLVFGFGLLASFLLANRVDAAIAAGQRAELGLCTRCGGVNEAGSCPEAGCPLREKQG